MTPVEKGGSREGDPLTPLGEYSNSCVARERVFEYCARQSGISGSPICLNYAVELRYGVLTDIARKVYTEAPVEVEMGYLNCIWQRDANEIIVRSLEVASDPLMALNLTGPEILSVRELANQFADHFGKSVSFASQEADTALLNNPAKAVALFGPPPTPIDTIVHWVADWISSGGGLLQKPTHFEVRDGAY